MSLSILREPRTRSIKTTIRQVRYVRTTPSGNPQFRVFTQEGDWLTEPDAVCNYGLVNQPGSAAVTTVFPEPRSVTLTLTKNRGRYYVTDVLED